MAGERKDPAVRKKEILETAISLFINNGYENTNVRDIAKNAGVTQGLLYHYFRSKEHMVMEAARYHAGLFLEILRQSGFSSETEPLHALRLMINGTITYAEHNLDLIAKIHVKENLFFHNAVTDMFILDFSGIVANIIQKGINEGIFHCEYPNKTASILLYAVMNTVHTDEIVLSENLQETLNQQKDYLLYSLSRLLGIPKEKLSVIFKDI